MKRLHNAGDLSTFGHCDEAVHINDQTDAAIVTNGGAADGARR
jgi:hypothetical protein